MNVVVVGAEAVPPPAAPAIDAWLQQAWDLRHEDTRAALALNQRACTAAWRSGDARGAALGLLRVALCHTILGDGAAPARALVEQAAELLRGLEHLAGEAEALNLRAHLHLRDGESAAALEAYGRCLALRRRGGDRHGEAAALHNLSLVLRETQRLADALELALAGLDLATGLGDAGMQAYTLHNIGKVLVQAGDAATALDHFERSLALAAGSRDRAFECSNRVALGHTLAALGRHEAALAQLQQAVQLARGTGNRSDLVEALLELAAALQAIGALDAARLHVDEALQAQQPLGDRRLESRARSAAGHDQRLRGDSAAACTTLAQALAAAEDCGADDLALQLHQHLAGLHEQAGEPAVALRHWRRFHALELRLRGPQVQRRLRDLLHHARQRLRRRSSP